MPMVTQVKRTKATKTLPNGPNHRRVKRKMAEHHKNNKVNLLNDPTAGNAKTRYVNYCIPGVLSRCGAGTTWEAQKKCKFAEKSPVSNRCMYYVESIDGHCDCVEAQNDQRDKEKQ